jgi:predicted ATP-dependent endonuclease of OLD family
MKLAIKGLRLVNCGPIDDIYLDFTDKETGKPLSTVVLAGANGCGKTTILEVLAQLPYAFCSKEVDEITKKFDYAQIDWLLNDKNYSLSLDNTPNILKEYYVTDEYNAQQEVEFVHCNLLHKNDKTIECKDYKHINADEDDYPVIVFFPHARFLQPTKDNNQINKEIIPYEFIHRYENALEFKGSISSYLCYLDYAKPEEFKVMLNFLNDLNFAEKTFEVNRADLSVWVKTNNGQKHRIEELSSGEQNILIMLFELRRRLNHTTKSQSIVLIDEIENSLHPTFQRYLLNALHSMQKITPFQLIVTTHSADILRYFGSKNIRILNDW